MPLAEAAACRGDRVRGLDRRQPSAPLEIHRPARPSAAKDVKREAAGRLRPICPTYRKKRVQKERLGALDSWPCAIPLLLLVPSARIARASLRAFTAFCRISMSAMPKQTFAKRLFDREYKCNTKFEKKGLVPCFSNGSHAPQLRLLSCSF